MNVRMKRLKRFYCSIPTKIEPQFTYYSNGSGTVATEFYYGTKSSVTVPATQDGFSVTEVGNTTFSLGALKLEDFEKPDNGSNITSITFSEGIEKI